MDVSQQVLMTGGWCSQVPATRHPAQAIWKRLGGVSPA
jgi:hypothetical protein